MNRKIIFVFLMFIFIFAIFPNDTVKVRDTLLQNYFGTNLFVIKEDLKINNSDALLVVRYVDKRRNIIDKAIIVSFMDNKFRIYLYINKNRIENEYGSILFNTDLNAYGWNLRVINKKTAKLWFDFYHGEKGIKVADSFRLIWDEENKKYICMKEDQSQY